MRQPVCAAIPRPVIWDENGVGSNGSYDHGLNRDFAAARRDRYPILVVNAMLRGESRMDLDAGFRVLIYQRSYPSSLGSRQILAHDPAGREVHGILVIDRISGFPIVRDDESSLAIGMKESSTLKQPRRSRMIFGWARPEHAHFPVESFVGDAIVVRRTATRCFSQLRKDFPRMSKRKVPAVVNTSRQVTDDLRIDARVTRRCNGLSNVNHAAFDIARHTFFFLLQAACEDDVRMACCFRHKEIDDAEELQFLERFTREARIG